MPKTKALIYKCELFKDSKEGLPSYILNIDFTDFSDYNKVDLFHGKKRLVVRDSNGALVWGVCTDLEFADKAAYNNAKGKMFENLKRKFMNSDYNKPKEKVDLILVNLTEKGKLERKLKK